MTRGFHKWRWRAITLWVVVFTALCAYGIYLGVQAHNGMCAIRNDVQVRHDRTEELLNQYPGANVFGIPRAALIKSLNDTQSTLDAIDRNVTCQP